MPVRIWRRGYQAFADFTNSGDALSSSCLTQRRAESPGAGAAAVRYHDHQRCGQGPQTRDSAFGNPVRREGEAGVMPYMSGKVLITGGAGFIGSHLVEVDQAILELERRGLTL